jgi:hypothetical protein
MSAKAAQAPARPMNCETRTSRSLAIVDSTTPTAAAASTMAPNAMAATATGLALGISREPYRDPAIRERLSEGLAKALSF